MSLEEGSTDRTSATPQNHDNNNQDEGPSIPITSFIESPPPPPPPPVPLPTTAESTCGPGQEFSDMNTNVSFVEGGGVDVAGDKDEEHFSSNITASSSSDNNNNNNNHRNTQSLVVNAGIPEPPPILDKDNEENILLEDQDGHPTTRSAVPTSPTTMTSTAGHPPPFPPPFFCPITKHLFFEPVVAPDGLTYEKSVLLGIPPNGHSSTDDNNNNNNMNEEENPQNTPQDTNTTTTTNSEKTNGLLPNQLYPNRALQRIMEEYLDLQEETWDAGIRRLMQHGMRYLWQRSGVLFSSSIWLGGPPPDRPLPEAYYCPITFDLFHNPVIDPEGNTYEMAAIIPWIRTNGTSPLSRTPLTVHQLYPNLAIRQLLEYHASGPTTTGSSSPGGDDDDEGRDPMSGLHPALVKWKTESPPIVPEWAQQHTGPSHSGIVMDTNINDGGTAVTANTMNGSHPQQQQQQQQQQQLYHAYPTTWEELDWHRQSQRALQRRAMACLIFSFVCFLTALVLAVLKQGYYIFVAIWLACFVRDGIQRHRQLRREHRMHSQLTEERLQEGQRRMEQLHARLQQLRQEQLEHGETQQPYQGTAGDIESGTMSATSEGRLSYGTSFLSPSQLQDRIEAEEQALVRRRHQARLTELLQQHPPPMESVPIAAMLSNTHSTRAEV